MPASLWGRGLEQYAWSSIYSCYQFKREQMITSSFRDVERWVLWWTSGVFSAL